MSDSSLEPFFLFLSYSLNTLENAFFKVPGSSVIARYVRSSHQNDPWRTLLEVILIIFAIRTLLQSRTRTDRTGKNFISFNDKEIDELVDEWTPEPLAHPLDSAEQADLDSLPIIAGPNGPKPKLLNTGKTVVNLASFNFTGLAGNEHIKERAVEVLRKYGLGSCGPPGFYGTLDVHMALENDIADFLGTESAILYSQGFSTIPSVIPAFCKRGDIIVVDKAVNFAIQRGIQISRSTVRWYDHNDLQSLTDTLESVEKERRKRGAALTRRFIVTEGIFEKDGAMVDLPKLIEIKFKYKYRLILDESISFGTVGRTGRGLTELYNVPASKVDMLVGSIANGLCSAGGFCAGSQTVVDHQRINGTSFVYSASTPALLAVSASEGISILRNTPSILSALQENIHAARSILDHLPGITIPSHPASPIIHICLRSPSGLSQSGSPTRGINHATGKSATLARAASRAEIEAEERILQEIVEEALTQGVLLTRTRTLRDQEMTAPGEAAEVGSRPSIRLAMTSALTRREVEKAVGVVKSAVGKVLGRRR